MILNKGRVLTYIGSYLDFENIQINYIFYLFFRFFIDNGERYCCNLGEMLEFFYTEKCRKLINELLASELKIILPFLS